MDDRIEIRTQDSDLGLTLLLWAGDLVDEFLERRPEGRLIIDDEGLAGRPLRNGILGGCPGDCRVQVKGREVQILCSSSLLFLRRRPLVEAVRKSLVRLGRCQDMTSINHFRVVRQQRRTRDSLRAALGGSRPEASCRFLLRIDDFPSATAGLEDFQRFHAIAAEYAIPYLLAVTPFLDRGADRGALTDAEVETLRRCSQQNVELALHGFTHRSRYRNYSSELASLPGSVLRMELERAEAYLEDEGLRTVGFVAPFNSYDPLTLSALTDRYPLLCGGPETVWSLGYRAGPSFLMQRLYAPSYRGVYDLTAGGVAALDQLARLASGLVLPIALHWANEVRDKFRSFRALCSRLAGATLTWTAYLSQAERVKARVIPVAVTSL